jgi:hypothetical protein
MASMSQEKKARIAAELKKIMPKGWKYTLGVHNHNTIVLNIMKAPVDLIAMVNDMNAESAERKGDTFYPIRDNHYQVNTYYPQNSFKGETLELMKKVCAALYGADYFDHSDSMTDYFHVAYYVDINVGKWNKPFEYVKEPA